MSGIIGPDGNQKQLPVDISKATLVVCEKCKNSTFQEVMLLFHFSAIASPNGQETHVPMPVPACNACGHINRALLPAIVKTKTEENKPKIEL